MYRFILCVFIFCVLSIKAQVDEEWVKFALETQRNLISSFTIDKAPLVGTHNSYSSSIYYSMFTNQELSITAQLELGVRYMELDLHVIPELNSTIQGAFRMCHTSSGIYEACQTGVGWSNCNLFGIVNYGEDSGCSANSVNFTQVFEEISEWMGTNPENVIIINFDDAISDADMQNITNMATLVNGWLKTYFGDLIYTPQDYATDGAWPTVQSLIARQKTLILNTNGETFNEVYIHSDLRGFPWPASKINSFDGFPSCTSGGTALDGDIHFGFFQEDLFSYVILNTVIYNGSESVGELNANNVLAVERCEYSTLSDFFSPSSAQKLVWSWNENEPSDSRDCGSINYITGKWIAADCSQSLNFACRSNENSSEWTIGAISSARTNFSLTSVCPTGFSFSTPRTAKENLLLMQENIDHQNFWISMTRYPNGSWSDVPLEEMATTSTSSSSTTTTTTSDNLSSATSLHSISLAILFVAVLNWL